MATPKLYYQATDAWVDVIAMGGGLAAVAGVTYQCVGNGTLLVAFTTAAPVGVAADAVHELGPRDWYYDKNGSAHCWVKRSGRGGCWLSATAD